MRNFIVVTIVVGIFCFLAMPSIGGEGMLSKETIKNIKDGFEMDTYTRAMYNAITGNDVSNLALNRDIVRSHNDHYAIKLEKQGITNQKSSGRCWIFAGLNSIRPYVIKKYKLKDFEFSQNYLAFWDKMEKANTFMEYIIEFRDKDPYDRYMENVVRRPFGDGGYWSYTVGLINKYGLVPKEAMHETNSSEKTYLMNKVIRRRLRKAASVMRTMYSDGASVKDMREYKNGVLSEIYRMLVMNLGEPPEKFVWRYESTDSTIECEMKTYTPKEFYQEAVGLNLNDFVYIFDNPTREYNKHYLCEMSRNIYDGTDVHYVSVPIDNLKEIALKVLQDSLPVLFAADVGHDMSRDEGIMAKELYDFETLYNADLEMSKADMCLYYESTSNHEMNFVGVDTADGEPAKWLVENSWGDQKGKKGYWAMYDDWFDNYVYNIVVHKKYLPDWIMDIYEEEPVPLKPWDPNSMLFRQ